MERFTKKIDGVWTALCEYGSSPCPIVTQEVIDCLAAYEDTGLTPEEVQQMRWIPVEERLPVVQGEYIVTACDEGCPYGEGIWYSTVVVVADYYKGCWTWDDYSCEYDISDIVTHWMPLPKSAKGGKTMNEPLTLEQLREMDGKPVWVENKSNPYLNGWGIMLENICSAYHGIFDVEEYGKTWLAYAYPLAHIDREAWKSCKACTGCASCRHSLASGSDSKSACFWCDNHNKYKPRSFCPECGRPLTEEAEAALRRMQDEGVH